MRQAAGFLRDLISPFLGWNLTSPQKWDTVFAATQVCRIPQVWNKGTAQGLLHPVVLTQGKDKQKQIVTE